jgi:DNA repair exonuclease SbcCD ATPase subunit
MKLSYISLCGFRGFREPSRIDLTPGFTIFVGPNGSGKSTICDAIEFALLGRIRPSSDHKEKRESIHDYLWWRGAGTPKESYVELGLVTDEGETYQIRRSPSALGGSIPAELQSKLITEGSSIDNPLEQLCRTAVLRDEDITRLSVDLPEADRFDFVRAALGSTEFAVAKGRAKEVATYLGQQLTLAQHTYEVQRNAVADLTAKLSALRAEAARATDLARVEHSLRGLLASTAETSLSDLAREAESALAQGRTQADELTRLFTDLSSLQDRVHAQRTEESESQLAALSKQADDCEQVLKAAKVQLEQATASLEQAQNVSPRLFSFAQLQEHGSRVGLVDGHCPLCGTDQSEEHFASHLRSLRELIDRQNAELASRISQATNSRTQVESLQTEMSQLRAEIATLSATRSALLAEVARVSEQLESLGVVTADDVSQTLQATSKSIESLRARSLELETALSALRASQAAAQLAERELELDAARTRLTAAERTLSRLKSADAIIEESVRTILRVQGELIDEQLATLSPLLAELFLRLRPHLDWQTVRYNLRGDVRRMLSLEVGDGLNPSFVFSSGQRRAAGLAFLLAIHMSRGWCSLRTLILDDPVQHVDDYRALHLTEVLSAIRRDHRQIICTVEDAALADLLARRLRSQGEEPGSVIRLRYESQTGSRVVERRAVYAHERRVLVAN